MSSRAGARSVLRAWSRHSRGLAVALGFVTSGLFAPSIAHGQTAAEPAHVPTPDEVRQAGAAYDRAVAARAGGDFVQAASLYETADRLAPSAQALGNAIRAHREVNTPQHNARAASLALRMLARYPDRAPLVSYAQGVVTELGAQLARVQIDCADCALQLDQRAAPFNEFFVEPGMHTVVAGWSEGRVRSHAFTARPGSTEEVRLTPPEPTVARVVGGSGERPANDQGNGGNSGHVDNERPPALNLGDENHGVVTPPPPRGGIPVPVTLAMLGVTVVLGGVLIWSGLDTVAGVPAYMNDPTPERLADGQGREFRTNVLIGAVSVAGAATTVMAIFTRWRSSASSPSSIEVTPGASGGSPTSAALPGLTLRGTF